MPDRTRYIPIADLDPVTRAYLTRSERDDGQVDIAAITRRRRAQEGRVIKRTGPVAARRVTASGLVTTELSAEPGQ